MKKNRVAHIGKCFGMEKTTVTIWNHRVVHRVFENGIDEYSIREVYYNDDGSIYGFTESPIQVYGDTLEELKETLQYLMNCVSFPVLEEDQIVCKNDEDDE